MKMENSKMKDDMGDVMAENRSVRDGGGVLVENGSVARGEGEIKPVMLENGSEGGPEEKTLKTAAEGVGGDTVKKSATITEAEARAMLIEDNARAKEKLKKANSRGKKTLVVVIILAVFLVVAGVATSIIVGGMRDDAAGNSDKQEGNGGGANMVAVENPEEPEEATEPEVVELSLEDETVKKIYGNFQGIPRIFDGWWGFYANDDVRRGEVLREGMLLLAGANLLVSDCVGSYEYVDMGGEVNECVSGEEVRQKVKEMFGQELEFTADDVMGAFCGGKRYDVTNDEFYQVGIGCGGRWPAELVRVLEKAERKGDYIYLYEKVLPFIALEYYHVGDVDKKVWNEWNEYWGPSEGIFGEKIGEYEEPTFEGYDEYHAWLAENERNLTSEYGDEFKWTFRKNAEGNYVFEGLERVE